MPNRIIRENILTSEPVCSLDWATEVFYRRLLNVVDDFGRFDARPTLIRTKCYPLQVDRVREADISRWMAACQKAGLIVLFQGVNGSQFLEVTKFIKDGHTPRSKTSKYLRADANICLQTRADENMCAQMHADADMCAQMQTYAPVTVTDTVTGTVTATVTEKETEKEKAAQTAAPVGAVKTKDGPEGLPVPPDLQNQPFLGAWNAWITYRKKIRKPMPALTMDALLTKFIAWGPERAVAAINHTIEMGWQGLREPDGRSNGPSLQFDSDGYPTREAVKSMADQILAKAGANGQT